MATIITEIMSAGPIGPRKPSASRSPPKNSAMAAAVAKVVPGRNPRVSMKPPVPARPYPPNQPNSFCAPCAAKISPKITRTTRRPRSSSCVSIASVVGIRVSPQGSMHEPITPVRGDTSRSTNTLVGPLGSEDFERQAGRAKAVVDVHHRDTGTAARQHRVQRNEPTLGNARADGRGNADYGRAQQAGDDRRECPIHSSDYDANTRCSQLGEDRLQAMNSRDADVEMRGRRHSHRVECGRRFQSDRNVGCAGGDYRNHRDFSPWPRISYRHPRFGIDRRQILEHFHLVGAQPRRHSELRRVLEHLTQMRGSLSRTIDNFGHTGARLAVMIPTQLRHEVTEEGTRCRSEA